MKTDSTNRSRLQSPNLGLRQGATIAELLVGIAIAGFISLTIASVYFAHYRTFTNIDALVQAETQNKLAMAEMLKYVHEGWAFSHYVQSVPIGSGQNKTLGIALLPLDPSGNPYDPGLYDHVAFYQNPIDPSRLMLTKYTDTNPLASTTSRPNMQNSSWDPNIARVTATGISDFNLTYNNADYTQATSVTITLTTQAKTIYGKTFTHTQTVTAYLKQL